MGGYIQREGERDLVLPGTQVARLIAAGDGDAALLYLCLMGTEGGVTAERVQSRLGWSDLRLSAAERRLQQMGLLPGNPVPPEPAEERPTYTTEDIANMLTDDAAFALLVPQTEEKLGKRLKTADLQILAGLYDDLGMPPDVIFLLVNHCVDRIERRYGPGRRPTMRQIEKEGYYWARLGIFDQDSAADYLRRYAGQEERRAAYLRVLDIQGRRVVDSEAKYIDRWIEAGQTPELVAQAYEQTIFYKKELNWRYLNAILRRWADNGWRTPEDRERSEEQRREKRSAQPSRRGGQEGGRDKGDRNRWMSQYIKK